MIELMSKPIKSTSGQMNDADLKRFREEHLIEAEEPRTKDGTGRDVRVLLSVGLVQ